MAQNTASWNLTFSAFRLKAKKRTSDVSKSGSAANQNRPLPINEDNKGPGSRAVLDLTYVYWERSSLNQAARLNLSPYRDAG